MKLSDMEDPDVTPGKIIKWGLISLLVIAVLVLGVMLIFAPIRVVQNAGQVAMEQYSPKILLEKYEWFKNASAQLDAKGANIKALQMRTKSMDDMYKGSSRKDWPRQDLDQYNLWTNEVAGVVLSYNNLAAEYNSQMSKFNWRFTNAGSLPQGATEILPREFRAYKTE